MASPPHEMQKKPAPVMGYRLVSCQRVRDALLIHLKKSHALKLPPAVWGLLAFFLFIIEIILLDAGQKQMAFLILLAIVGTFFLFRWATDQIMLRFDAGSLIVERKIGFLNWLKEYKQAFRRTSQPPVMWVITTSVKSHHLANYLIRDKTWQYETRIPYRLTGRGGTICVHENESQMREMQQTLQDFWNDVPFDEYVWEKTKAAYDLGDLQREKTNEIRSVVKPKNITPSAKPTERKAAFDMKSYQIDRNEISFHDKIPSRNDERQQSIPQGMVTFARSFENKMKTDVLELVSTRGSKTSTVLATLSIFYYRTVAYLLFGLGIGFVVWAGCHWERFEIRVVETLQNSPFPEYAAQKWDVDIEQAIQRYVDAPLTNRMVYGLITLSILVVVLPGVLHTIFCAVIRVWGWRRWFVRFQHGSFRPYEILFRWQNDRYRSPCRDTGNVQFFRAIPATPETNRLLTGKRLFDANPGWKSPCQVVFITDEGTFPLPCVNEGEQKHVIETVKKFLAETMPHLVQQATTHATQASQTTQTGEE